MTIKDVSVKIDLRMNKSASGDYDNIWPYVKGEAFNKAISDLTRRVKAGRTQSQEGDEETSLRVDDLQVLLAEPYTMAVKNKGIYSESSKLPKDYLYHKRVTPIVTKGFCESVEMTSYLREEANVDVLKHIPSFKFEETFHTIANNKIKVYHNKEFHVEHIVLIYYRKPKKYDFKRLTDEIEFKDDVCELFIDEACKIIASDIESLNQKQLAQERAESDN